MVANRLSLLFIVQILISYCEVPIPFVGKILSNAILTTGYSTQYWFHTEFILVYARNMAEIIATIALTELLSNSREKFSYN
jgi:hypothetical protein